MIERAPATPRAAVAAFHRGIAVGDRSAVADALAPDVVVHSPVPGRGTDLALRAAERCFTSLGGPPAQPEPCFSVVDEDIVATCYRMPQSSPDGTVAEFFWIDAVRLAEGKVVEWWPSINEASPTQLTWTDPIPGDAQADHSPLESSKMKQLAVDFYRYVFDSQDASAIGRYVTDDYHQHAGRLPSGRRGLEELVNGMFPQGPRPTPEPMTLEPVVLAAEGDIVVHGVQLFQRGAEPDGGTYPYIVFDAYRVRDGKLAEHWSGVNPAAPPLHEGGPAGPAGPGPGAA